MMIYGSSHYKNKGLILNSELLNSSGTMSLCRILGYRWHDYMSDDLVHREAGLRQVAKQRPVWRMWAWRAWRLPGRWPDGGLSEGYGHGGPGVCLGDSQTEAEGVPSQGGHGDALLRRMLPYLTWYLDSWYWCSFHCDLNPVIWHSTTATSDDQCRNYQHRVT